MSIPTVTQVHRSYKSSLEPQRLPVLTRYLQPVAPAEEVPHAL